MDMAGVHAAFLVESLISWFSQAMSESEALAYYHQRRNEHAREDYHRTVTLAQDLRQLERELD
ncbi:MAG: hypothetical protein NVSMB27_43370 [Ktedonobacteraceae bacterium]